MTIERHPIHEEDDIRAAFDLVLYDCELVHGHPVVVLHVIEVDDRACVPAMEPSLRRCSTVTPSTSIRCTVRLFSNSDGASLRVSFR